MEEHCIKASTQMIKTEERKKKKRNMNDGFLIINKL